MRSEVKVDGAAVIEFALLLLKLSDDRPHECQSFALRGRQAESGVEEGAAPCEAEEFGAFVLEGRDAACGQQLRVASFGGVDAECADALFRPARACVVDAECSDA